MIMTAVVVTMVSAFSPQTPSPYSVDYVFDGTLTLGSFALLLTLHEFTGKTLDNDYICSEAHPDELCDPSVLRGFDRGAVGNHSKAWDTVGDIGLYGILGAAAVGTVLDNALSGSSARMRAMFADTLVIVETAGITTVGTHIIRYAIRRPRPTQYVGGVDLEMEPRERHLSFPSGHSASASAVATAYATTFWLRHPESPWRWVVAGSSVAASSIVSYSRVAGGRHFPSDVIAGQLIGTVLGILVPILHESEVSVSAATNGVRVSGAF